MLLALLYILGFISGAALTTVFFMYRISAGRYDRVMDEEKAKRN